MLVIASLRCTVKSFDPLQLFFCLSYCSNLSDDGGYQNPPKIYKKYYRTRREFHNLIKLNKY